MFILRISIYINGSIATDTIELPNLETVNNKIHRVIEANPSASSFDFTIIPLY